MLHSLPAVYFFYAKLGFTRTYKGGVYPLCILNPYATNLSEFTVERFEFLNEDKILPPRGSGLTSINYKYVYTFQQFKEEFEKWRYIKNIGESIEHYWNGSKFEPKIPKWFTTDNEADGYMMSLPTNPIDRFIIVPDDSQKDKTKTCLDILFEDIKIKNYLHFNNITLKNVVSPGLFAILDIIKNDINNNNITLKNVVSPGLFAILDIIKNDINNNNIYIRVAGGKNEKFQITEIISTFIELDTNDNNDPYIAVTLYNSKWVGTTLTTNPFKLYAKDYNGLLLEEANWKVVKTLL
jgi:hypothetical protein